MSDIPVGDVDRLRLTLAARLGLNFGHDASDHLADVFRARLRETGCATPVEYWDRFASVSTAQAELRHLASELTVPETYFFRHPEQYLAFAECALRRRLAGGDREEPVRILSAGCASGEEAYSLAAIVGDVVPAGTARRVEILGIDVNPVQLKRASLARYNEWSLRATAEAQRRRYFRREGRQYAFDGALASAVRFEERNLLADDEGFWRPGAFDIIFCRNVMIYFAPETIKVVVARMAAALRPGGFLFLGASETLRGVSDAFHLRHTHGAFYYERRDGDQPLGQDRSAYAYAAPGSGLSPRASEVIGACGDSWIGTIDRASQRIAALAERSQVRVRAGGVHSDRSSHPPGTRRVRGWDLSAATELLRQERFSDVMEALRGLPSCSASDPDVLILRAVVLTNVGDIEGAEQACLRVLALDEMNAGAHYLRALCREHAGDRASAAEHDQVAIYLDPTFAMPRLHLGLMGERAGDTQAARRELRQALTLLEKEDAARILLFGGGFHRDSLAQLCRSKLRACGGDS